MTWDLPGLRRGLLLLYHQHHFENQNLSWVETVVWGVLRLSAILPTPASVPRLQQLKSSFRVDKVSRCFSPLETTCSPRSVTPTQTMKSRVSLDRNLRWPRLKNSSSVSSKLIWLHSLKRRAKSLKRGSCCRLEDKVFKPSSSMLEFWQNVTDNVVREVTCSRGECEVIQSSICYFWAVIKC